MPMKHNESENLDIQAPPAKYGAIVAQKVKIMRSLSSDSDYTRLKKSDGDPTCYNQQHSCANLADSGPLQQTSGDTYCEVTDNPRGRRSLDSNEKPTEHIKRKKHSKDVTSDAYYPTSILATAEVEFCEPQATGGTKVAIADVPLVSSTDDKELLDPSTGLSGEGQGSSSSGTYAHSFKHFTAASWFPFPRSSDNQHSSNHRRTQSSGTTLKYDESMENVNSGWKCLPEIRHMSLPDGMMTMEESKERMMQTAEAMKLRVIQAGRDVSNKYKEWKVIAFQHLPDWLRDNDFLHKGHRPPIPSVCTCFKSVFKIHTETGNIWTHLIGSVMVVLLAIYFLVRQFTRANFMWTDIAVMVTFFICALLCLTFSWLFHTLHCHSNEFRLLFSKLDYVGIAVLIVGSFVPWLYYGFYCNDIPRLVYISSINILGIICIIISLWDRFAAPKFRPLRAGLYIFLGLSALVPAVHFIAMYGVERSFYEASFGWMILMAILYISGACLYALRIPERFFPGKFDLWGHSHQIFHVFVVIAIFVHYYGVDQVATFRVLNRNCEFPSGFYPNQSPHTHPYSPPPSPGVSPLAPS
ncbi:uncharacterized protein LOC142337618 [Convolutriloba macropyga]|uniref:uncharacterized protein LOC142337618 n=1 Tax=Convolutriloba macropyga TaxID=536237 RepID=UPI003F523462